MAGADSESSYYKTTAIQVSPLNSEYFEFYILSYLKKVAMVVWC